MLLKLQAKKVYSFSLLLWKASIKVKFSYLKEMMMEIILMMILNPDRQNEVSQLRCQFRHLPHRLHLSPKQQHKISILNQTVILIIRKVFRSSFAEKAY